MPYTVVLENKDYFVVKGKCAFPGCKNVIGQVAGSNKEINVTVDEIINWEETSYKVPCIVCKDCQPVKKVEKVKLPDFGHFKAKPSGFTRG